MVLRYQLAKRARRNAFSPRVAPISGGPVRNSANKKGSGGARHGSARAPQFRARRQGLRSGLSRDHAHDLPKKVRAHSRCGTRLSAKAKDGGIIVWANASLRPRPRPRR